MLINHWHRAHYLFDVWIHLQSFASHPCVCLFGEDSSSQRWPRVLPLWVCEAVQIGSAVVLRCENWGLSLLFSLMCQGGDWFGSRQGKTIILHLSQGQNMFYMLSQFVPYVPHQKAWSAILPVTNYLIPINANEWYPSHDGWRLSGAQFEVRLGPWP